MCFKHSKKAAFTLFELILVILLSGILLSIAIPKFSGYSKNTCMKKMQLQMLQLRLNLKTQNQQQSGNIDWDALYAPLDFTTKNCHFSKQNDGIIVNIYGNKAYFELKDSILECQHTKSARLHNKESLCDVL